MQETQDTDCEVLQDNSTNWNKLDAFYVWQKRVNTVPETICNGKTATPYENTIISRLRHIEKSSWNKSTQSLQTSSKVAHCLNIARIPD